MRPTARFYAPETDTPARHGGLAGVSRRGVAAGGGQVSRLGSVAQLAAQDLADVGLRQFGAELDVACGMLVAGEVVAAVRLDLFGGERRVLLHDHDLDRFAGLVVRHADRGHFEHARHHRDHVLDLVRVHVEARHQDHVLLAVDDVEETLLVHLRHVAGVQPAVGVDDLGGLLRALPVALHHLRALDAQLADFAHAAASLPSSSLTQAVGGRDRQADGAVVVGQVHRIDAGGRRGLGQAVGLDQGDAGDLLPALGDRALHRHAAAQREVQRARNRPGRSPAC